MLAEFNNLGQLPPGIHAASWSEFTTRFGWTPLRRTLIHGLETAIECLSCAGCKNLYVDGSFVTKKITPRDYDVAWDPRGVDLRTLRTVEPLFFDLHQSRPAQKAKYGGEFFPSNLSNGPGGKIFLEFFQADKDGNAKGIVLINIRGLVQ